MTPVKFEKFGAGQSVPRVEDRRLVTGAGRFADDLDLPGQLHAVFVRSPHAHADIVSIDTGEAAAQPGIVAVWTGADLDAAGCLPFGFPPHLHRADGKPMSAPPRRALALGTVRHVGEAVAVVVAETRRAAEDAAEFVVVDYAEKPAVVGARRAAAPGAPALWPEAPGNVAAVQHFGDKAAADAAFAKAAHVVALDFDNQRLVPMAMEPRAALAEHDAATGRTTLHCGTQNPTTIRQALADAILKVPVDKVRVVVRDIGGGFGMKAQVYAEYAVLVYGARKLGRPIKWRADRSEEFQAGTHGRDQANKASLALDGEGRILALRVETLLDIGAYCTGAGAIIGLVLGPKVVTGVYAVPVVDITASAVLTNTVSTAPYRGAGRPEAIFIVERLMDKAARTLGLDPIAMRKKNMIPAAALPARTAMGETYDSGDFARLLDDAAKRADVAGFPARRLAALKRGRLRGLGISSFVEWTGANQFTEKVTVLIGADGRVAVHSATQAMGQGLETSYAQIAAAILEIPIGRIDVIQGDTDLVQGFGSMGSRSLYVGGAAVAAASYETVRRARDLAADALEAAAADIVYAKGRFAVAGTDRAIALAELAKRQKGGRIEIVLAHSVESLSWPNGTHVCEVEIDPDTGTTEIARYTTTDDVGRAVNPAIVLGQIQGGIVQAVGQALHEGTVYDAESGQLVTGSLMDYGVPRADDVPMFDIALDESQPCRTNPLGAKGCGESGTVGGTPAVVNALVDALAPFGVDDVPMPATPLRLWSLLHR
jgi:aerobic carbon-monoxide dehydrogenase large subunit